MVRLPALFHGHNHLHVYRGLRPLLDAERPDLVHADEEPYSAVTGQIAALCASRRVPFLFFAWQNLDKRLPLPFRALRRGVFSRAAGGICGTARAAAVLRRAGYEGPVAVIPQMGVDPEHFRPSPAMRARVRARLGVSEDTVLIGFVGRLVREKGVALLLEAASGIEGAHVLVIGGGPEEDALQARATALGIADRARFTGVVPSSTVADWLTALDVLAQPSLTTPGWAEQFGRTLVEAMASGVAVVGSASGEIPEVIGDAGLVVREGSVAALRDALIRLVEGEEARRRLGATGRARVLDRFTQDSVVDETIAFYGDLL